MSTSEEFRANAQECFRMARAAHEATERATWTSLAESWLRLAHEDEARQRRLASWPLRQPLARARGAAAADH